MRDLPNDERRLTVIREMRAIVERERPWIELFHMESYALVQGWMHNVKPLGMSFSTFKYLDVDPALRHRLQVAWNRPVRWPAVALVLVFAVVVAPAVADVVRRRR